MSIFVVCHTSIKDVQELNRRLEEIRKRYANVLGGTILIDDGDLSHPWDTEILQEEGVDFHSVSKFFFTRIPGDHDYWPSDAVEILKKEFSDVEFIAMHQNESLL